MNKLAIWDLVIIFSTFTVFQCSYASPTISGIRYLNYSAGGNEAIAEWANSIMQMPLEEVTDDYTNNDYLVVKESLYKSSFNGVYIGSVYLVKQGNYKSIQICYGGGSNIYIGDENIIKSTWHPRCKDGDIYLEYMMK